MFKVPNLFKQFLLTTLIIVTVSMLLNVITDFIGYRVVALLMLMIVSLLSLFFDIFIVIYSASISALIWNFFFIPPLFTFHIEQPEDTLLFLMYFVIALIHGVLTKNIRKYEFELNKLQLVEESNKFTKNILSSLSHELKTPISTILGAIDTLITNEIKISKEIKNELYNEIEIASLNLNDKVENLLNLNRIEAGILKPNYDWYEINEIIFIAINKVKFFNDYKNKNQKITFYENRNFLVKTDKGILEEILINILSNSIRYSPACSNISIITESLNNKFQIIINDEGTGIPESSIPLIFNKFYKVNSNLTGGIGLGMAIVKGYVEILKGEILVCNIYENNKKINENNKIKGLQVILTFPTEYSSVTI